MTGWGEDCQYDQLLYDRSLVRSSLVEDFQLVCDRAGPFAEDVAGRRCGVSRKPADPMGSIQASDFATGWLAEAFGEQRRRYVVETLQFLCDNDDLSGYGGSSLQAWNFSCVVSAGFL